MRYAPLLILFCVGASSCGKPADGSLSANIATALSNGATVASPPDNQDVADADAPVADNTDDLNSEMSEAANMSVAIGSIQGFVDGGNPDPDGAGPATPASSR